MSRYRILVDHTTGKGVPQILESQIRYNYYFATQGREKSTMQIYASLPSGKADLCKDCGGGLVRLLLISDTHGRLGIINELARHVRADAVIHAGNLLPGSKMR